MSPNFCIWNPCWSTLRIFIFPIPNIFSTLSQPERAISEETILAFLLAILLMSAIHLLLANASISTSDSIEYFNIYSVRSTKTSMSSQITLMMHRFYSIAQDISTMYLDMISITWILFCKDVITIFLDGRGESSLRTLSFARFPVFSSLAALWLNTLNIYWKQEIHPCLL